MVPITPKIRKWEHFRPAYSEEDDSAEYLTPFDRLCVIHEIPGDKRVPTLIGKLTDYDRPSHGKPCVFPFIYKKFKFHTCTNLAEASGKFWCSSTDSYDRDHQWSYCPA
ncbi:unnamed protein product [Natator depressus]